MSLLEVDQDNYLSREEGSNVRTHSWTKSRQYHTSQIKMLAKVVDSLSLSLSLSGLTVLSSSPRRVGVLRRQGGIPFQRGAADFAHCPDKRLAQVNGK